VRAQQVYQIICFMTATRCGKHAAKTSYLNVRHVILAIRRQLSRLERMEVTEGLSVWQIKPRFYGTDTHAYAHSRITDLHRNILKNMEPAYMRSNLVTISRPSLNSLRLQYIRGAPWCSG